MREESTRVVFADQKLEADYRQKSRSNHPEDLRLYSVLKAIRLELGKRWRSGKRVAHQLMPTESVQTQRAPKAWRLKLQRYGTVVYIVSMHGIRIVDIL